MQLYGQLYGRYARARLDDAELGAQAVAWTLGYVEADWDTVLASPEPTAVSWALLREAVTRLSAPSQRGSDWLHTVLPAPAADAVLLRYRLGFELSDAAHLMGVREGVMEVDLRAALRMLART
ncbi:hypothetical protein [Kitasatospora sp. NPDC089509]|uniref:hypothetical protein n=1 Tax=Kitasatospora sp. NPDC089509 TaxID=3364079 RepID=UPI003830E53B